MTYTDQNVWRKAEISSILTLLLSGGQDVDVERCFHERDVKWENVFFLFSLGSSVKGKKHWLSDQSENGGIFLLSLLDSLVVPLGGESVFAAALGLNAN